MVFTFSVTSSPVKPSPLVAALYKRPFLNTILKASPSNMASVGGYLLTPDILPILKKEKISARGEIELSEAINELSKIDQVYCKKIDGVYHDTGDKQKYLEAIVDSALTDQTIGTHFRIYLEKRLKKD